MRIILIITLLLTAGTITRITAQEIITDRPGQTESSSTIPKGNFQIESGIVIGHKEMNIIKERQILAPTTLFRYGLTKGIEIRVVNQYENNRVITDTTTNNLSGFSDLEIGSKIQLLRNENLNTEIAFLTHLIIPTGSTEFSNEKFGSINKLSISHSISGNIDLGYNIGYNYFGSGNGTFTYSMVLGFGISDKLGLYLEPYGEWEEFDNLITNFDSGLTYLVSETLQLDFSFGNGINHKMNYLSMGFSWNVKK